MEVDGQKFDVWCIGTMAFEMFSGLTLYRKMKKRKCRSNDWHKEVYPVLKKLLQVWNFFKYCLWYNLADLKYPLLLLMNNIPHNRVMEIISS